MPEKWDQVKELFTLALERDSAERGDFLRQACGGDDVLRSEIESLLSSFDGATNFLEDSPVADLLSAQSRTMAGKRIGAYRILGEIGHGGMAVVYLAERADDQYRKRVAIKMLQPGTNKDEILRRFRNERQALAALDHPSIVRLLDGGSTEEGLPYLIMEYVEGVRIDEYCDTHKLSITKRLQLFCAVCLAVQYAHETLVIHRDLKPSNILITRDGVVARSLDLFRLQLEASLALGEIQMQERNPELGRKRLEDTEENASSKGFELIAQKASTAHGFKAVSE